MEKHITEADKEILEEINNLSHEEMLRLWRFAASGHIYFDSTKPYAEHFLNRFNAFGAFNPTISKIVGWEND